MSDLISDPPELTIRSKRFNDTTGAITWNHRSAALHPDRCVCQGDETTPHKHYPTSPHSCARCLECQAYTPAAPSVSSSAPPPTWDEMASMFPDNSKRANRPRGSSAEPAPPTKKCSECQTSLNEGEGKCFTVCDQCWDKTYRTISGAEKSSALPAQEETTPTPKNQRIEVSITITGGDGVQRHELAGTIQMQARNAAKKRGLTVDCCTTNDEGL